MYDLNYILKIYLETDRSKVRYITLIKVDLDSSNVETQIYLNYMKFKACVRVITLNLSLSRMRYFWKMVNLIY